MGEEKMVGGVGVGGVGVGGSGGGVVDDSFDTAAAAFGAVATTTAGGGDSMTGVERLVAVLLADPFVCLLGVDPFEPPFTGTWGNGDDDTVPPVPPTALPTDGGSEVIVWLFAVMKLLVAGVIVEAGGALGSPLFCNVGGTVVVGTVVVVVMVVNLADAEEANVVVSLR